MFRNYFKVAIRNLARHPGYTSINILGLAIGIACCTLIMLFVRSELSFDRFHTKSDRIYRAWLHEKYSDEQEFINTVTPLPLGKTFEDNFHEVELSCRVLATNVLIKNDKESFNEDIRMVDASFFDMFDFPLLEGNIQQPFPSVNSIIITGSVAKKYFGNDSPLGKTLVLQIDEEDVPFTVSGLAADCPEPSSIQFDFLIPFTNDRYFFSERQFKAWTQVFVETYFLLKKDVLPSQVMDKFPALAKQIAGDNYQPNTYMINLQPITAIHLDDTLPAGIEPISSPVYSYILSTIGFLILLIACINFITLSVGRSTSRALEVGVRKVLGAQRQQLIRQFWGEALIITLIATALALSAASLLIKPFDQLIGRPLSISFDPMFILYCFGILLMIALIAGIYPAIVLSGFKPIEALKGKVKAVNKIGILRRSLIIGQFAASIGMIICTLLAGQQLHFIKNKNLGYLQSNVIIIPTNKDSREGKRIGMLYCNEIRKSQEVESAGISLFSFSEIPWASLGYEDDSQMYRELQANAVDPNFVNTMEILMVSGKNFSEDNPGDMANGLLVNETLAREYGWDDPIGKKLPGKFNMHVIGVMKDFNYESLHTKIEPLLFAVHFDSILRHVNDVNFTYAAQPRISVRVRPGNLAEQIALLKSAWKSVVPDQDFEYHFLDDAIAAQYQQEQRTNAIIQIASLLSIIIACLGLFGLVTLVVTQRTREIGIRKILGAQITDIVTLLSREFAIMILIASVIAVPLSWFGMNKWLQDFAYRIHIEWWVFIIASVAALLLALITISIQAVKAALANPVTALRSE